MDEEVLKDVQVSFGYVFCLKFTHALTSTRYTSRKLILAKLYFQLILDVTEDILTFS